ncbi:MAG: hypothetical protein CVV46_07240 [Spirochaetae bacterium HGW-Spirochaetae-2]|nr:MAG: hypothetical protein CVV46_07240 [Spirochaetae bacterium HGW-Spirochaetae-2]
MPLHFPTLGLVLLTVGFTTSVILVFLWRINREVEGPGIWALASIVCTLGYVPLWLEPQIGNIAIILNNISAIGTLLLILEGILRFRRFSFGYRNRFIAELLYFLVYMASTTINLENARARYLVNDLLLCVILLVIIYVLLIRHKGMEGVIYGIIAGMFVLLLAAFSYRWSMALSGMVDSEQINTSMTTVIFFTLTPWSLGWTFGLVVILNIRTQQTLWDTARRDPLTGLYNRLWMMETFSTRLGGNQNGTRKSFCVAIIDINGFKLINDTRGHILGDEVLRKAADILNNHLGPTDSAIRYGGDEFILLIDCAGNKDSMGNLRERLVRTMETPTTLGEFNLHFSVSIGTAMFPEDGETVDELLKIADDRMYMHKRIKCRNTEISNKEALHG